MPIMLKSNKYQNDSRPKLVEDTYGLFVWKN